MGPSLRWPADEGSHGRTPRRNFRQAALAVKAGTPHRHHKNAFGRLGSPPTAPMGRSRPQRPRMR
jgi:hypothetical protein